jgi:GNAT superfamily N-acetyltransferase
MHVHIRPAVPADADACARIHVAASEASYRGIMPDEEFERRPLERRRQQWHEWLSSGNITLVACDDAGDVLGFAGARLLDDGSGFDAYLTTLYLRPDMTSQGVGKTLLRAIAGKLFTAGARNMVLRTLRLNANARAFYEHMGARFIPEGVDIDAGTFDDVAYAFDDLHALLRYSA